MFLLDKLSDNVATIVASVSAAIVGWMLNMWVKDKKRLTSLEQRVDDHIKVAEKNHTELRGDFNRLDHDFHNGIEKLSSSVSEMSGSLRILADHQKLLSEKLDNKDKN